MTQEHDDLTRSNGQAASGLETNPFEKSPPTTPVFPSFDERAKFDDSDDERYEEPERDTDYTQGFREEHIDIDRTLEDFYEEDIEEQDDALFNEQAEFLEEQVFGEARETDNDQQWDDQELSADVDDSEFADERPWFDEDFSEADAQSNSWPLGLIAIAAIAVLLLFAGGYGVIEQRGAAQEEIRQLRAALATAANPEDVSASRQALQEVKALNSELTFTIQSLGAENQRLADTVAGLEKQLDAQVNAAQPVAIAKPAPAIPKPEPATPRITPTASPAFSANGEWFVNFGSYGQQDAAQVWVNKLQPGSGKVIMATSARDGITYYRVRVVGLPDKNTADSIARRLEGRYGLSKLWVGQE